MTPPTVYAALAAVMADCDHVSKRDRNTHQNFVFRGIDAVVNAVGPVLRKHQVIVVPQVASVDYETVQTTTGKPSTACRVKVAYVFYGPAGDCIETSVIGEAWDAGDKAAPKAMSVAFRTALLQALALPTDDPDPDTYSYERAEPPYRPQTPTPVPHDDVKQAKDRVWRIAARFKPDQGERKAYIAAALTARGFSADNADHLTQLADEWEQAA